MDQAAGSAFTTRNNGRRVSPLNCVKFKKELTLQTECLQFGKQRVDFGIPDSAGTTLEPDPSFGAIS